MITLQQFASVVGCTQLTASGWYAPFTIAMAEFGIDTTQRLAMFLAQVGHESASLSRFQEDLNYTAQRLTQVWPKRFPTLESAHYYEHSAERLANFVYANRMGNGGYESGDGFRYRGRGPIMITGGDMYRRCGAALNLPLIEQPEMLLDPKPGARSACWYWTAHGCNEAADAGDVEDVTLRINGGRIGLEDRIARTTLALKVLA